MGYEEDCEHFAMFGDPAREHWEHEFNARHDYLREAFGDTTLDADTEIWYDDIVAIGGESLSLNSDFEPLPKAARVVEIDNSLIPF